MKWRAGGKGEFWFQLVVMNSVRGEIGRGRVG